MGSERASTARRRQAGTICAICSKLLGPPPGYGERFCETCGPRHNIYMHFFHRYGWTCNFLEPDLHTPVCRPRIIQTEAALRETIARGKGVLSPEDIQLRTLDGLIDRGRGGVHLDLSHAQYLKLKGR